MDRLQRPISIFARMSCIACALAVAACGSDRANTTDAIPDMVTPDSDVLGDSVEVPDSVLDALPDANADTIELQDIMDGMDIADTSGGDDAAPDTIGDTDVSRDWSWERLPDLPTVLQEHAVVAIGGDIYLLGGFENLALVSAVRRYDTALEDFSAAPALPRALHHLNAAAVDARLWVLGSLEGFGFAATGEGWVLDPAADTPTWEPVTAMANDRRRGSAGVAVVGEDVYVLGGFRGGAVADCDVYRTALDRWDALPSLPAARDHAGAAAMGDKVYLVGGRQGLIGSVEADLWRFDPKEPDAGWVALTPMPTARGGIAVGVVTGPHASPRLIVAGGEGNAALPSGVFAEVEIYDPATDRWESLAPMPAPRHGMQAVGIGPTLFVPGGADVEAFGATRVFEALTFTGP